MTLRHLFLLSSLVALPSLCYADQVINFEGYADGTVFTTQYNGVNFNGATVLTAGQDLDPNFPPHSGKNVVYNPNGPLTVDFSSAVNYFQGFFTYTDGLSIEAYDSSHTMVGSYSSVCTSNYIGSDSGCAPNEFGMVTGSGIMEVVITGRTLIGSRFVLDDAEFTGSVNNTDVPEPGTFLLLGTGLLGVAGSLRRRLMA